MPAAPRHARQRKSAARRWAPAVAAVTLCGVAAAVVFLHGGSAAPGVSPGAAAVTAAGSDVAVYQVSAVRRNAVVLESRKALLARRASSAARRQRLAAARLAQQQAAAPSQSPTPAPSLTPTPAPSTGGGNPADSSLGICIRDAEEGGSYAWGPGNGGGAYQFLLGTWETYGGAASEYGVAGPAYQDQIFDNAIAAGGASNWTDYDGC